VLSIIQLIIFNYFFDFVFNCFLQLNLGYWPEFFVEVINQIFLRFWQKVIGIFNWFGRIRVSLIPSIIVKRREDGEWQVRIGLRHLPVGVEMVSFTVSHFYLLLKLGCNIE